MSDLFPAALAPSPKLQWLARYGLHTAKDALPRGFIGPADKPWRCSNAARTVNTFADTEEEAILLWCSQMGVRHWTVEQHWVPSAVRISACAAQSTNFLRSSVFDAMRAATSKEINLAMEAMTETATTSPQQEQGIDFDE